MKKLLLFSIATYLTVIASAQKVYFLYLQTDNQSPFYVRMADKIFSSATSGYLIFPNLTDSTYNLNIGFAKSTKSETKFSININQNDKGFLIKTFDDGLALFDMQDLTIVKANSGSKENVVFETKSDKFSSILSKAADDPGLLKVQIAKKEEPKAEPPKKELIVAKVEEVRPTVEKSKESLANKSVEKAEKKVEKKDPVANIGISIPEPVTKTVEDVKQPAINIESSPNSAAINDYKLSVVRRHSESSTTEGFGITYFDNLGERIDTIRILIPSLKSKLDEEAQTANLSQITKKEVSTINEPEQKKVDVGIETHTEKPNAGSLPLSSCKIIASEKDFMKLRKNMAAKSNDEEMISEARKSFKSRCFTPEQIRYLSTLFISPAAKYQFFDTAYNYVSDKPGFSSLQSEMKDEYYLKRFKALIGE